jgi:CDP-6-deoxy-D-xylo-4-hexulose-3-dehydrase
MEIKIGTIYKSKITEDYILIIDKNEDKFKFIPLSLEVNNGRKIRKDVDIEEGRIDNDLFVCIDKLSEVNIENIDKEIATLRILRFDAILRDLVKYTSDIYYKTAKNRISKNKQPRNYIPPSGKVIDENELHNMIDSSLDMWLTTGRFNEQFEKKLSDFLGLKYALTTNSGSSANLLAVTALTSHKLGDRRLKAGDEVITVAAGFPTTVAPIIMNNLIPVFLDVEVGTYNIDVSQIEEAITNKTKAIVIAHTLGNTFALDKITEISKKYNLWLIEDNCDALGSKYDGKYSGTFGDIATLSFYPAHHITMGEGGALLTDNKDLYDIIMSYRDWGRDCWCKTGVSNTCGTRFDYQLGNMPHGYDHKYIYSHLGYNLKITDWQASIALAQMDKLPEFINKRRENFDLLYNGLEKFSEHLLLPEATEKSEPSWFGFLITVKENNKFTKNDLVKYLEQNDVGTRQLFAGNLLRQPAFLDTEFNLRIKSSKLISSSQINDEYYKMLPNTDNVMNNTFWIGVWPGMTIETINFIIDKFERFFL